MSDDRTRFEELYRDTRTPLLAYLSRRAPADDAADLLAEVYLVAWRRRADLPAGDEQRLWLYGVARRLVAEHYRTSGTRADAEHEAGDAVNRPQSPPISARDTAVHRALDSLNDVDRELVTLTVWERLSPAEAARVVGISANTARVRLHRARARLGRHPALQALLDDDTSHPAADAAISPPVEAASAR
ncbi:RNA polymerase sigma factor [Geodermatophilus sp. FMUSA9-8]|uniref:RNA polymerase sigma factor n=1 Tax=Geodermatophilus sp. FMUSA9-8 TaxID=3120155 RepID=UPI0030088E81